MDLQTVIAGIASIIGERGLIEFHSGIKVGNCFLYSAFISEEGLELMNVKGNWRKLEMEEGELMTFEMDAKGDWREVETKWADEQEILKALATYFEIDQEEPKAA